MPRRAVVLLALAACTEPASPDLPEATSHVSRHEIPVSRPAQLDVLFVIDNSQAMAPHRDALIANATSFAGVLTTGGVHDLHLGFVTTDVGTRGPSGEASVPHGDCTVDGDAGALRIRGPVTGNFVTDLSLDGARTTNYTGDLSQIIAASLDVGATGCSFVRPLETVRRALDNPNNNGFLRPRAFLAIVFLTAQDDCSFASSTFLDTEPDTFSCIASAGALVPPIDYAAYLKSLKRDASQIIVSGAFGPTEPFAVEGRTVKPSCTIDQRSATPGTRLQAFLDQFPNRSVFTSICQPDLSEVLLDLSWHTSIGAPCLDPSPVDVDLDTPGIQRDCAVTLVDDFLDHTEERVISECSASLESCWQIESHPEWCPIGGGETINVKNAFVGTEADFTLAVIECVTQ
jgi:hypothetical protein